MSLVLRFLFCCLGIYPLTLSGQSGTIDSLEQLVSLHKDPVLRADAYYELIKLLFRREPDRAKSYCLACISVAESSNYAKGMGICLNTLGVMYQQQQQLDSATYYFEESIDKGREIPDSSIIVKGLMNLGLVARLQGNYQKAVTRYWETLPILEKSGNIQGQAISFTEIGNAYIRTGDDIRALSFQLKAQALFERINDQNGLANVYNSIGVVYIDRKQVDSALYYYEKSAQIKESLQDWLGFTNAKNNLCGLYSDRREFAEARVCYEALIEAQKKIYNRSGQAISLVNMANLSNRMKQYRKGIPFAEEAYFLAREINNRFVQKEAFEMLTVLHSNLGEYKKALSFQQQGDALKDSMINEAKAKEFAELQAKYEADKREQQIRYQSLELEKSTQQIRWQWILGGVGLLVIGLGFGALFWYQKQRETQRRQALALKHQEKLLTVTVDTMENERKRISKDLHDGIGQQLSGLKMAWQGLTERWQALHPEAAGELTVLSQTLQEAATEVRSLSHQMMPLALRELGLVPAMEDMLQKSLGHTDISYEFEHFGVKGRFPEKIEIGLYRIAQELINNIIKHAGASEVSVELYQAGQYLILTVTDNGQGFDPTSTQPEGMGMSNIQSRAQSVKGQVEFERGPEQGVYATIKVPLS